MSRWLASVRSLAEIRLLFTLPTDLPDIIDLKEPRQGALGALPTATVRQAVTLIEGRCQTSATIGDLPMKPTEIQCAVEKMAATGVDYVKVGLFADKQIFFDCLPALRSLAVQGVSLVGVMFADKQPDFSWIPLMQRMGFKGVMLDTSAKESGNLLSYQSLVTLADFVKSTRRVSLLSGLAGSLRVEHIPLLLPLEPHYLGFRSALCQAGLRESSFDLEAIAVLRHALQGGKKLGYKINRERVKA